MKKIIFLVLVFTFSTSCNNGDKSKETTQTKKDTLISPVQPEPSVKKDTSGMTQVLKQSTVHKNKGIKTTPEVANADTVLPTILFVTTSEACDCVLRACANGDSVIKKIVQPFSQKIELKQIDYAKEKDSVDNIVKKYRFYTLPVLIIFDRENNFKYKFESPFDENLIQEKLKEMMGG